MVKIEESVFCDGCGVEILVAPVARDSQVYCCDDCAEGYECKCAETVEIEDPRRADRGVDSPTQGFV